MTYPLFLKFTGTTIGRGFAAQVEFDGKFLGVNPSTIAECGADLDGANARLREAIKETLAWIASESETYEAFETAVWQFVRLKNEEFGAEWDAACTPRA